MGTIEINWLHLTDLHFGLEGQQFLWPRVKDQFFADLARVRPAGGWDLVLFTGDLTQSGKAEEFESLEGQLGEIWKELELAGRQPKLCVVPGNHDLSRLDKNSPVALSLSQLWQTSPELRNVFWSDVTSEYRKAVEGCFAHYSTWLKTTSIPLLDRVTGLLPGDFGALFTKENVRLGIVGLNTAGLQLSAGDYREKLDLHVSQVSAVCGADSVKWRKNNAANILMTHHPPTWLTRAGLKHFRAEINAPGEFQLHLCGHQHEPASTDLAEEGAPIRRLRQAASLFGLEYWDGLGGLEARIHGYVAGRLTFADSSVVERNWPRVATRSRSGALNLGADPGFTLEIDGSFSTVLAAPVQAHLADSSTQLDASHAESVLLGSPLGRDAADTILAACARLSMTPSPSHVATRLEQRADLICKLEQRRHIWLAADWGMGAREFLASSLEKNGTSVRAFVLSCDEVTQPDGLERAVQRQFGVPIQTFCAAVETVGPSILVLENLHPEMCEDRNLQRVLRIVSAVLDYGPQLRVVITSRLRPQADDFPVVELVSLDLPDVRAYVAHHVDAGPEMLEADTIEKLYRRTDGLPIHLDSVLRGLRVSSVASLLDVETEPDAALPDSGANTPALAHAIASLMSEERHAKRSVRLLKVLTVLPHGETIEALKHYLQTEPFFPQHALNLLERALLEIHIQHEGPNASSKVTSKGGVKVLKVPRQVRDYVQVLLTEQERDELVHAGLDRFFGPDWREGKAKQRSTRMENRDLLGDGLGNEFALLHYVLNQSIRKQDVSSIERNGRLALQFATNLSYQDRYRDLYVAAVGFLNLLNRVEHPEMWAELAAMCGEGLRMTGRQQEALTYLADALTVSGGKLTKDDRASIWIDLALCEASLSNADGAVAAAREVEQLVPKQSSEWYQAQAILVDATLKGRARAKRLVEMEKEARNRRHRTVADNIALDLAREATDTKAKLRYHDRVLNSGEFAYNQVRAAVGKARALQQSGSVGELGGGDLVLLAKAYSYLHTQRLNVLFEQCHEALWVEFEARRETHQLLRLFRHTSFLWRIRGNEQREADYLRRLQAVSVEPPQQNKEGSLLTELQYFWSRVRAVLRLTT
jgi:hypothetical protein